MIQDSESLANDSHFDGSMNENDIRSNFRIREYQQACSYDRKSRNGFADRQGFTGLPSRQLLPNPQSTCEL